MKNAVTPSSAAKGIACMVAGGVLLTLSDAIMKWLTGTYPVGQIIFLRGVFVSIPVGLLVQRFGGLSVLRVHNVRGQAARAGLTVVSAFLFFTGLSYLPLADTIAINFVGPLFITVLATPVLGERVGLRRWVAVSIGFAGVVLMLRPGAESIRWAALLPLGSALAGAGRDIITRRISVSESSTAMLTYTTLTVALAGLCTYPLGWVSFRAADVALLAVGGFVQGSAQYLMIEAFRSAEAAMVAPLKYLSLVWAVVIGFLVWGDLPDTWVAAGSVLVIGSGLFIWYRERRARQVHRD